MTKNVHLSIGFGHAVKAVFVAFKQAAFGNLKGLTLLRSSKVESIVTVFTQSFFPVRWWHKDKIFCVVFN